MNRERNKIKDRKEDQTGKSIQLTQKVRMFEDRTFYEKLMRLMIPIALQGLMLASVAAADAVMLGRLEQNAMSAVSLATQIQFIQNMALASVTATIAILGAQYWGKGDKKSIVDIFNLSLKIAMCISILFCGACLMIPELLMKLFTNDADLIRIGAGYLRIAGVSYLLVGISQSYISIMRVTDHVKRSALISSCAVILNIILNGVFIYGLFGLPSMGARGAALATLIARIIECAWAVGSSYQKGFVRPEFSRIFRRNKQLEIDFARCALPLLGAALFWGIGFTSYTAVIGHMGADAAAAGSVSAVVRDLLCCVCDGISAAGGIMVGNELGAGRLKMGKIYGIRLTKIAFVIGFAGTAAVLVLIGPVAGFMSLTDQARDYLVQMMIVLSIYMIGRCVNTIIINGIFGAGGDTLFDMYSLAVMMWGVAVPLAFLGAFVFHWPVMAVYACTCLDEVGKIPWVMHHFVKYKWVKDLTRERVEEA